MSVLRLDGSCFNGVFLFFKQKTAYELLISDWSSDVCSSDLDRLAALHAVVRACRAPCIGPIAGMELPMRASLSIRCSVRVVVCCPGCIFRRGLHAAPVPFVIVISARQRRAPAIAVAIDRGDFQHPDRKSTRLNSSH